MFGVHKDKAGSQEAGTVIGRLCLLGQQSGGISDDQYQALKEYGEAHFAYMKAIEVPDSLAVSSGGKSLDDDVDEEMRLRASRRYNEMRRVVRDLQFECRERNLFAAIEYLVIKDQMFGHMVGDIRLVGNALHRHSKRVAP